jgi:phosphoglycerate kinase
MRLVRHILDEEIRNKIILVRVDLNVPMHHGKILDSTRIRRIVPTIRYLTERGGRVVLLSHFGRPKGQFDLDLSLAPLVDAVAEFIGQPVRFGVDCVGVKALEALSHTGSGEVVLLENLRFYAQEEQNDPSFVTQLAALGDMFINDTFSCSHRAHASIVGLAERLPAYAGFLLEEEYGCLEKLLKCPDKPLMAIVGGSKVSTKLALLSSLIQRVDTLVIGGAMANSFLLAEGYAIGQSLCEKDLLSVALGIKQQAKKVGCHLLLPEDVVVAEALAPNVPCRVVAIDRVKNSDRILDIGPKTLSTIHQHILQSKTLVWNGPVGAFETDLFAAGTAAVARMVAGQTACGALCSIAGGGDTVAALAKSGLQDEVTYLSTAGGAFLEWLEGRSLPGIEALCAIDGS